MITTGKLNPKQQEMAIQLRQNFLTMNPDSPKGWEGYVDLSRAIALMLDATEVITGPQDFKEILQLAWRSYAKFSIAEQDRILLQALNNDQKLVDKVRNHDNGQRIIHRIISRVKEKHGGLVAIDASSTEVTDILVEEMDDSWLDEM